jgi:hypothetical protein
MRSLNRRGAQRTPRHAAHKGHAPALLQPAWGSVTHPAAQRAEATHARPGRDTRRGQRQAHGNKRRSASRALFGAPRGANPAASANDANAQSATTARCTQPSGSRLHASAQLEIYSGCCTAVPAMQRLRTLQRPAQTPRGDAHAASARAGQDHRSSREAVQPGCAMATNNGLASSAKSPVIACMSRSSRRAC